MRTILFINYAYARALMSDHHLYHECPRRLDSLRRLTPFRRIFSI
jgi:hypothetical protein